MPKMRQRTMKNAKKRKKKAKIEHEKQLAEIM